MTVQAALNDAARSWLRSMDIDVYDVRSVQQETVTRGVCETCRHDEITVVISYTDRDDEWQTFTYYGDLGGFIRALDDVT